jgi:hypothetical protein
MTARRPHFLLCLCFCFLIHIFCFHFSLFKAVETEKANLRWLLTAQRAARAREVSAKGPGRAAAAIRVGSSRSAPTTV